MGLIPNLRQHYTVALALSSTLLTVSSANFDKLPSPLLDLDPYFEECLPVLFGPVPFDNQAFSQALALPYFVRTFGDCEHHAGHPPKCELNSVWLSLFNSVQFFTFAMGIIGGTWFQARYGRRLTIRYMCIIPFISGTIIITASNRWQLLAGRLVHYLYAGIELGCIPVYQAELVPAEVRGFAVGSYQMSYGVGNLLMAIIIKGTSNIKSNASFRIPYGTFYIVPTIVGIGTFWLPESPRWLLSKGRRAEALSTLRRIRKNCTEETLEHELHQTEIILETHSAQGKWKELFQGTNRRRTLILLGVIAFNQLTGIGFVSQYGAVFTKSLGAVNPQTMGIVQGVGAVVATTAALMVSDRWGRRPIFLSGAIWQSAVLFIMGGCAASSKAQTLGMRRFISALPSIYGLGYGFGSSSVNHVLTAEIPHQSLRDKTQRIVGVTNNICAFAVSFTLPYLLNKPYANLGPKVGFIYGSISFLAVIFGFFCLPEPKGKSLEEINLLFYHNVSARKSAKWTPPIDADKDLEAFAHADAHARSEIVVLEEGRAAENQDVRDVDDLEELKEGSGHVKA